MDVWQYILHEKLNYLPCIFLMKEKQNALSTSEKVDYITLKSEEKWEVKTVRCRTIGDMTCTGVTESKAVTIEDIIEEVRSKNKRKIGSIDDKRSESCNGGQKREGYF